MPRTPAPTPMPTLAPKLSELESELGDCVALGLAELIAKDPWELETVLELMLGVASADEPLKAEE